MDFPASAATKCARLPELKTLWPVWGVLVALVWLAFRPVLGNGFVDWDDRQWILENHAFRGLGWAQVRFAFTTFLGGVYQPLGWLVQSACYELFGLAPWGYHLVSLLFHGVNVVLLHLVCVRLVAIALPAAADRLGSALGWLCAAPVALYAVHPLRVEPVAWASCQAYLPGVVFSLLATLAYLRAHSPNGTARRFGMVAPTLLVVLAVLSKGSAVVLPFVFLIVDAYPLRRFHARRRAWRILLEKVPMLLFCLGFLAVAFAAKHDRVEAEISAQPWAVSRVAQAAFSACFYIAKSVWPFGITAFYPRPESGSVQTPLFAACVTAVLAMVAVAFWQRRRWPWLLAALAAYLVIALPYLGLARVSIALAADRYSYAPTMAWVVLLCAGLCSAVERWRLRRVLLAVGAGTIALGTALVMLCTAQCRVWGSSERLWSQALEHAEWSSELHYRLGVALAGEGKRDRASGEFREALRLRPDFFDAAYQLGAVLEELGQTDAAIAALQQAGRLRPHDARVLINLGAALGHQGHFDQAIALYREALRFEPNFPNLYYNLGYTLLQQRKLPEAIAALRKAVQLRPWYTEAHANLARAYILSGLLDDATHEYQTTLQLDPNQSDARINLGLALARQGHASAAVAALREAIARDPQNAQAHYVLGAILISQSRRDEAAVEFESALRIRPDHAQARAFLSLAKRPRR